MGNKLGKKRQVVDEKYTRPQGLFEIKDVDYKKLRKLILESKLAPCYPGGDECDSSHLEECPICFLYYPTLNRSRCCMKSICTECFLQMKNPNSTRPTQCPFCKTANYAVEYRGTKSKEERGVEEIEEQKVIEAKIRMRQQQLLEEEERQRKKAEISSSNRAGQIQNPDCSPSTGLECEEVTPCEDSRVTEVVRPQNTRRDGDEEFDVDLEDIMVMEAIWLSIQENGSGGHLSAGNAVPRRCATGEPSMSSLPSSSSSPSGGLACAIAALAERQQLNSESLCNYNGQVSPSDMIPSSSRSTNKRVKKSMRNRRRSSSAMETYSASEVTEVGTSYASSDEFESRAAVPSSPPAHPLYRRRKSKRVKNDQRKYASAERASSKDICEERMLEEQWQCDHGLVATEVGTSYGGSDESDEGAQPIRYCAPPPPDLPHSSEAAVLPPPPLPLYGWQSSKSVKNNRRKYSSRQRASSNDACGERMIAEEFGIEYGSMVAEARTTYGSNSDESDEGTVATASPPAPLHDGSGTSRSCSDDEEDDGDYVAQPPLPLPQPLHPYGWWPSVVQFPVQ